jgi:hypothetical protein
MNRSFGHEGVFPLRLSFVGKARVVKAAVVRRLPVATYARKVLLEAADRDLEAAEEAKISAVSVGAHRKREAAEPPLTAAEAETILGRPLAQGVTFDGYRILTGRGLPSSSSGGFGGDIRE